MSAAEDEQSKAELAGRDLTAKGLTTFAEIVAEHWWRSSNDPLYAKIDEKHNALILEIEEELQVPHGRNANVEGGMVDLWIAHLRKNPDLDHPQIPDWIRRFNALDDEYLNIKKQIRQNREQDKYKDNMDPSDMQAGRFANAFELLPALGTCVDALLDAPFTNSGEIFQLFEDIEDTMGCDHYRVGGDPGVPAWIARIYGMDYMSFHEVFPNVTLEMLEGWLSIMHEILGVPGDE